jgi:hypothetical protein
MPPASAEGEDGGTDDGTADETAAAETESAEGVEGGDGSSE